MTTVFIINGKPRAGKDTLIRFMRDILDQREDTTTASFSSIDPIKRALTEMGIDLLEKTDADRKLLQIVGDAVEEHSNYRTEQCVNRVTRFHGQKHFASDGVFFLHIREPFIIEGVRSQLHAKLECKVQRVKVESTLGIDVDKPSDKGTDSGTYDHVVTNNGTLGNLYDEARDLLKICDLY